MVKEYSNKQMQGIFLGSPYDLAIAWSLVNGSHSQARKIAESILEGPVDFCGNAEVPLKVAGKPTFWATAENSVLGEQNRVSCFVFKAKKTYSNSHKPCNNCRSISIQKEGKYEL